MRWLVAVCVIGFVGCGAESAQTPPATPEATGTVGAGDAPPVNVARTFDAQVAAGQTLYADKCASCHGTSGEGGRAPRVIGLDKGALPLNPPPGSKYRTGQFKNALDVATFVVKNMPADSPGSLKEADYWAILAFDLHANGVDLPNELDANTAKDVVLHQ